MQIAVIGAGRVGIAIGAAALRAGHDVVYGTRDPGRLAGRGTSGRAMTPPDAAREADIIVLALPFAAAEAVAMTLGPLTGKIVIDCMNPIAPGPDGLGPIVGLQVSGGEQVAHWLPQARVVKTLNQVGAEVMADVTAFALPPLQFIAGDDPEAKGIVAGLLTDIGFAPLDAGGIAKARLLEGFALLWISQAIARKLGRNWAFATIERLPG
jgi:8-hydroxy-5-deazaflavin:NADPH oxidoreductase